MPDRVEGETRSRGTGLCLHESAGSPGLPVPGTVTALCESGVHDDSRRGSFAPEQSRVLRNTFLDVRVFIPLCQ